VLELIWILKHCHGLNSVLDNFLVKADKIKSGTNSLQKRRNQNMKT
jgi:hypothetical protein